MDEDGFKALLDRTERTHLFRRDVGLLLQTLVLAGADVMQRFCAEDDCGTTATRLCALRDLVDAALATASRVHGRKTPRLNANWGWTVPRGADT